MGVSKIENRVVEIAQSELQRKRNSEESLRDLGNFNRIFNFCVFRIPGSGVVGEDLEISWLKFPQIWQKIQTYKFKC